MNAFRYLQFFLILLISVNLHAQNKKFSISGEVRDAQNGEDLIGAVVSIPSLKIGVSTNAYGFYSLSLAPGNYELEISYIGYQTQKITLNLNENTRLPISLKVKESELNEVLVKTDKPDASNVQSNKMSVVKLDIKQVKKIPLLLGELDIVKAVQLLPGIQQAGDGNTLFVVRGGNVDHNLVLLDEAVVYNPSHVLGFF
jgi:uncharacterized membrane protein